MGPGHAGVVAEKRIGDSPRLRDELALAAERGIAPRRLWGWEPSTILTPVYADVVWWKPWTWRRVLRTISTPEAEFDEEQVDLMLAAVALRNDTGGHGHLLSETTSEHANPNYYGPGWMRFGARGPFTDWAEKARLDAVDAYRAQFPKDAPPNLNGMYWVIDRTED
ncbi:MAG: hypothetical protein JWP85_2136 [Rhodoglobus sp.]|nr:hypothetical protein [Rhodoglobus sp.]